MASKTLIILTAIVMFSQATLAMESSAKISESTAEEVEMPIEADKDIILRQARPDVTPYIMSRGQYQTPILNKAFEVLKSEPTQAHKSGVELALEILKRTSPSQK
ncbi:MAG: DUF2388 domain-containing protein [Bdellovibrionales bacterium]